MTFQSYGASQNEGTKKDIDYDALNKYVVETAGLQSPETLVGVVSGLVDLGTQAQADAEMVFNGTPEDEEAAIAEKPSTYFKNGTDPVSRKPVRYKCWPQKPIQSVAIAVDFPDILLNKGQFFGDDSGEEKPLRLWLGGEFWNGTAKVVAKPIPLRIGKDTKGRWSFNNKHTLFKMAVASKLIAPDGVFLPQDIDKIVGKAFQFEVQVYMKAGKDGKSYFTEKITFKAALGRGQAAPELPVKPFVVQFNEVNDEQSLKELRYHIVSTIKNAINYEGSPIQKQLEAARGGYSKQDDAEDTSEDDTPPAPKVAPKPAAAKKAAAKPAPDLEDLDDGAPF
jgi:hypothetical protein